MDCKSSQLISYVVSCKTCVGEQTRGSPVGGIGQQKQLLIKNHTLHWQKRKIVRPISETIEIIESDSAKCQSQTKHRAFLEQTYFPKRQNKRCILYSSNTNKTLWCSIYICFSKFGPYWISLNYLQYTAQARFQGLFGSPLAR